MRLCERDLSKECKGNYKDCTDCILDKIKTEIDIARFIDKDTKICKNANAGGLEVAMQIIDKYRK